MLHHLKAHLRAHPSSSAAPTRILVFALYKKEAQRLESTIRRAGYNVGALHGDMGQDARFRALDKFKNGSVNVLVATDVAARGLDIPDVGLVLNVTFPLTTGESEPRKRNLQEARADMIRWIRGLRPSNWPDWTSGEEWESSDFLHWRESRAVLGGRIHAGIARCGSSGVYSLRG
jgi:hypothetical protein